MSSRTNVYMGALLGLLAQSCAENVTLDSEELAVSRLAAVAKGQLCVSSGPERRCVPSGGDIAPAYQAVKDACKNNKLCSAQLAIYPTFPVDVVAKDAIRSKELIKQYLADHASLQAFAKTLPATDYSYALGNLLEFSVRWVHDMQTQELARPDPNLMKPLNRFEAAFRQKAATEVDPLVMELADSSQAIPKIQEALTWAQRELRAPRADYTELINRFTAYRASEATTAQELEKLSLRASAAQLTDLAVVSHDVASYSQTSAELADELMLDASRLRATLEAIESRFRRRVEPYHDLIEKHLGGVPALTADAQTSLAGIVAYAELRRTQTQSQLEELAQGIALRREALISLAADAITQKTLRDSAFLKASGAFLDEATTWVKKLGEVPSATSKYGYTLWTDTYDQCETVLQLEPLCNDASGTGAPPSWREAGCISFRRSFGLAHDYIEQTIPQIIRLTIPQLRRKGVSETMLTKIESELAAGHTRSAVVAYDAAAQATEVL